MGIPQNCRGLFGKDEVPSSNLGSSSIETLESVGIQGFLFFRRFVGNPLFQRHLHFGAGQDKEIGPAPSFEVKKIGQDLPRRFGRSCFLLVTKTAGSVSGGAPQKSFSSSIERSEMLIADLAVWEISR